MLTAAQHELNRKLSSPQKKKKEINKQKVVARSSEFG